MSKNKQLFGLVALVLLAILAVQGEVLTIPTVFAQQQVQGQLGADSVGLMTMLGIFITFFQVIAYIALWIVQYLLSTDFLTDPNMLAHLNQIWVLSRDLMNLAFALILIGVAIYTIVTAKKDLIQSKLVSFFTAVILVNFSWFFPRVIIDIANVLTSTIYSIPNMLPNFTCEMRDDNGNLVPCKVLLDVLILPSPQAAASYCPAVATPDCKCMDGIACYKLGNYSAATQFSGGHAMINGLAVSFARLTALARVPGTVIGTPGTTRNAITVSLHLVISSILVVLLLMAATLPLVGLALGLLIRMVILWLCIAFMPFAFLGYAINGKLGVPGLPAEYDIWQNFKTAAFLPTVVAIPYCVGFIMLSSVQQIPAPNTGLVFNVPLINGINSWWGLMWLAAAIGIIYTGAFTALRSNALIGKVTDRVKSFGDSVTAVAMEAPKLIPLPIPGPGGGNMNLGQALNTPRQIQQAIQSSALTGKGFKETLESIRKGNSGGTGINYDDAAKRLGNNEAGSKRIVDAIQQLNNSGLTGGARDAKLQEIIKELNDANVPNANRLTAANVLPELRQIAQRQGSAGTIGSQLNAIDGAQKAGRPPT